VADIIPTLLIAGLTAAEATASTKRSVAFYRG